MDFLLLLPVAWSAPYPSYHTGPSPLQLLSDIAIYRLRFHLFHQYPVRLGWFPSSFPFCFSSSHSALIFLFSSMPLESILVLYIYDRGLKYLVYPKLTYKSGHDRVFLGYCYAKKASKWKQLFIF
ncbi:MAG: hypothetical protein NXY57DRAFT_384676 [Lentinula lateritia]|nr:MAG: hypothetical protein NXY57DRAFT_384676 [Lentinula lateritia]